MRRGWRAAAGRVGACLLRHHAYGIGLDAAFGIHDRDGTIGATRAGVVRVLAGIYAFVFDGRCEAPFDAAVGL